MAVIKVRELSKVDRGSNYENKSLKWDRKRVEAAEKVERNNLKSY